MNVLDRVQFRWGARLPMTLQTEAAECGIACLAMIAGYYGYHADLADIRRIYGVSLRGATLEDLVRAAERLRFSTRPVRLDLHELPMLKTPCVLHWDLNHFVVLKSVGPGYAVIHDPSVGVRRLTLDQVSGSFTGVALELTPTGEFRSAERPPAVKFSSIIGHMRGLPRALFQLLILALAIEVFAVTSPLFMQFVVDHALVSADQSLLVTLMIGFALLLLINTAVTTMRGWMLMTLSASMKVQARANLFSHLSNLPTPYFEARHLGDILSRFNSQDSILRAVTTDMIEAVLDGLMVCVTLTVMFVYAPGLAVIVLLGACAYGLLRWLLYRPLRNASAEAIVWGARRDSYFLETLRGVRTIKLFNGLDNRRARWLNLLIETVNRQLTTDKLRLLFRTTNSLLFGGITIAVIGLGAAAVMKNELSVGMLLAFVAYKDQFQRRSAELINRIVDLQMLRLHAERLADIALTAPEPMDAFSGRQPARGPVGVSVRNLSFRYGENEPWVLRDLNFDVAPGESVAVTGPSGCGKTTLLKLLAGLMPPTSGDIFIDGEPLSRIGRDVWRAMIGVVMQDDKLFAGSVQDNICFFSERPDLERIEHCARLAAVHDDIVAMSMGYQTLIGDMGTILSGGQQQRLLIARALYREPSLLLLDEATSHLDVEREKDVSAAIAQTEVTRIIIAHRPETIRTADRIVELDGGRIVPKRSGVVESGAPRAGAWERLLERRK